MIFHQEAHGWYKELKLPESELAEDIVNYQPLTYDSLGANEPEEDWGAEVENPKNYYKLKLSSDRLHLVDTVTAYHNAVENIIKVSRTIFLFIWIRDYIITFIATHQCKSSKPVLI